MRNPGIHSVGGRIFGAALLGACALVIVLPKAVGEAQPSPAYGRVELSQPYAEFEGSGVATLVAGNQFNGALQVELPFAFPYFGREYRHAWLSTNGSVLFLDHQLESNVVASLEAPAVEDHLRGAIHAVRGDLVAGPYRERAFTAHVTDGGSRVVFQWRGVAFAQGERLTELNFQVHLYPSGRIRLWYGPEWEIFADSAPFVSGIVSPDGTLSVPGFGDTLVQQLTRPASGRVVELVPDAVPPQPNALNLVSTANSAEEVALAEGESDVVVASFELHAFDGGGSFDEVDVRHPPFPSGSAVTLSLVADEGEVGVYEPGTDTVLASESVAAGAFSTKLEFAPQQVGGATPVRRYLLLATVASLPFEVIGSLRIRASEGDVDATVPVYGGVHTPERHFSPGPLVTAFHSTLPARRVARAGDRDVLLASIQLRRHDTLGPAVLEALHAELLFAGMSDDDLDQVNLLLDVDATGTLEPHDALLGSGTVSGTSVSFTGLNHPVPPSSEDGLALLLTADISSSFAATGFVGFDQSASTWGYSDTSTVTHVLGQPTSVRVLGSNPRILVQRNEPHAVTHLPVQPGDSNVPAMSFTMQTSLGSTQLQEIRFVGNTSGVQAARLYYDNGQHQGRWDFADTLINNGTVDTNALVFADLQNVTLDDAPRPFLLVIDLSPAVASGTRQFTLSAADVTAPVSVSLDSTSAGAPPILEGVELAVGDGSAQPGVDVAVSFSRDVVDFGGEQIVPFATVSVLPRAGGGEAPSVVFSLVDSRGGVTDNVMTLIPHLDATASGLLEEGDPDLIGRSAPLNVLTTVPLSQGVTPTVTSQTRVYLIGIRREFAATGTSRIVFRGVTGGTNPQIIGWPSSQRVEIGVGDEPIVQPGSGGGGCATLPGRTSLEAFLPLMLLVVWMLAWRRRAKLTGIQTE